MVAANVIQPGEGGQPAGEIPFLHLPERHALFHDRAARLRSLAQGHTMGEFLLFVAHLCDAQQAALDDFPNVPLPPPEQIGLCREHGMPPLSVQSWVRDPAWQDALARIVAQVETYANPVAKESLVRLRTMDPAYLEAYASAILAGRFESIDLAIAPFVAAALQVYWAHMANALGANAFGRSDVANLCPVCASPPVSSIVRIGGDEQGLRYLSCSVCQTQWHMVRVKCSNCESTKGIGYYSIEGSSGAVKAESCDECGTYLKIKYMEKDPNVDPVADDLATMVLDLLMDQGGKLRSGPNLFLVSASDSAA